MTLIVMPAESATNLVGSGSKLFPAGPWQGRIDVVRSKGVPMSNGKPFAGYESDSGEVLSLQIGTNFALDGQDDVGEQKFFVDITVEDGDNNLSNVDVTTYKCPHWQLQRGAKRMMNLAIALGAATLVGSNGDQQWTVEEDFVEQLRSGSFDGMPIGFSVLHRKTKSEKTPIVADLESFHEVD